MIMRGRFLKFICAFALCWVVAPAAAMELPTPRAVGLGQGVVLSDLSSSSLLQFPSIGITSGTAILELGLLRRFELKDLDEALIAGGYRWGQFTAVGGFSQFGQSELYTEKTFKLAAAYHFGKAGIGATWSHQSLDFGGGYSGLSASTLGASVSYRRHRVILALAADNLTSPVLQVGSPAIRPQYRAAAEMIGRGSFSIVVGALFEEEHKPRFSIGQNIDVSTRASLLWSFSSKPLTGAGGLEVSITNGRIGYYLSYYPTLGFTHCVSLSYCWRDDTLKASD
ncbi:MAG: hypothetical protein KOO62_01050 [candidate division Zixibacteria bacterium]|nr:hypothetical protein [candidate division Zixibacteria bacterium]